MRRTLAIGAVLVLLWTGLIFVFSSEPYKKQSIQPLLHERLAGSPLLQDIPDISFTYDDSRVSSRRDPFEFLEFIFRKSAHLFMYGMLAIFWSLLLGRIWRLRGWRLLLPVLAVVAATASLDEWNQSFVEGRTSLPSDVGIDLAGGLLGFLSLRAITMLHNVLTRYRLYHKIRTEK